MKLTVLGSGSTGNAVLIVAGNTRVLVDAGLSAKEIARRLATVGEDAQRLDAVLVTHEHGDHAGGLRVLLNSLDCPVYISGKTLDAYLSEKCNVSNKKCELIIACTEIDDTPCKGYACTISSVCNQNCSGQGMLPDSSLCATGYMCNADTRICVKM